MNNEPEQRRVFDTGKFPEPNITIVEEAEDRFACEVLLYIVVSRAHTTPEQRRSIIGSVRAVNPPLRGGNPPFREVVRRELVARGLFSADQPIGGEELPFGPDREPL